MLTCFSRSSLSSVPKYAPEPRFKRDEKPDFCPAPGSKPAHTALEEHFQVIAAKEVTERRAVKDTLLCLGTKRTLEPGFDRD